MVNDPNIMSRSVDMCIRVHVRYYNVTPLTPTVTSSGLNELQIAFVCRETLKVRSIDIQYSITSCCVCTICTNHVFHVYSV